MAALTLAGLVLGVRDRRFLLLAGSGAVVLFGHGLHGASSRLGALRPRGPRARHSTAGTRRALGALEGGHNRGAAREDDVSAGAVLDDLALAERNDRYAG